MMNLARDAKVMRHNVASIHLLARKSIRVQAAGCCWRIGQNLLNGLSVKQAGTLADLSRISQWHACLLGRPTARSLA